jgi:hypothetical protein
MLTAAQIDSAVDAAAAELKRDLRLTAADKKKFFRGELLVFFKNDSFDGHETKVVKTTKS